MHLSSPSPSGNFVRKDFSNGLLEEEEEKETELYNDDLLDEFGTSFFTDDGDDAAGGGNCVLPEMGRVLLPIECRTKPLALSPSSSAAAAADSDEDAASQDHYYCVGSDDFAPSSAACPEFHCHATDLVKALFQPDNKQDETKEEATTTRTTSATTTTSSSSSSSNESLQEQQQHQAASINQENTPQQSTTTSTTEQAQKALEEAKTVLYNQVNVLAVHSRICTEQVTSTWRKHNPWTTKKKATPFRS